MEQQQRITVKQTVFELLFAMPIVLPICLFNTVIGIVEGFVHFRRNEKVWNDIIALCHIITKPYTRLRFIASIENIKVPLDNIPGVSVLLVDRFRPKGMSHLVIFRIANIICLACLAFYKALRCIEVVNNFPVFLLLIHAIWQRIVANQVIDYGFKDNIKTFYKQIFFLLCADKDLSGFIKESIA